MALRALCELPPANLCCFNFYFLTPPFPIPIMSLNIVWSLISVPHEAHCLCCSVCVQLWMQLTSAKPMPQSFLLLPDQLFLVWVVTAPCIVPQHRAASLKIAYLQIYIIWLFSSVRVKTSILCLSCLLSYPSSMYPSSTYHVDYISAHWGTLLDLKVVGSLWRSRHTSEEQKGETSRSWGIVCYS